MMYSKAPITIGQQIAQLKQRGLIIDDEQAAQHFLSQISYYRLAGYWWTMQSDKINHFFKPNSHFADVIALYNFDRELRLLIFDVIERIEIALRSKLIYHLSHEFDPWWFQDVRHFINSMELVKSLANLEEELERSKDIIAAEFRAVNHTYLPSWLQSIAQIRNICAHHGRLWNKNLPGKPNLLPKPPAPWLTHYVPPASEHHMLYIHLCCMKYLIDVASPGHHYAQKLATLLVKYPSVDLKALGIPVTWKEEPLWHSLHSFTAKF